MDTAVDAFTVLGRLGFSVFALLGIALAALAFSSYIKIVTVLGFIRVGLGFYGIPSVMVGGFLALSLSFFVMFPTIQASTEAIDRVVGAMDSPSELQRAVAIGAATEPWRQFLVRHVPKEEKVRFVKLAAQLDGRAEPAADVPSDDWRILAPAFVVSELQSAFLTGFSVFLPLLLVDLLVASTLVAVGLDQVNAHVVSFPFKVLLFIMVDGWSVIAGNLVSTYM